MKPRALITGITGQDGSYLAEFLLSRGYNIFGLARHTSAGEAPENLAAILHQVTLIPGDITDRSSVEVALAAAQPDEVYNLAAQSFVPLSWQEPSLTFAVNLGGLINIIEGMRFHRFPKLYQASSSEMYGQVAWSPGKLVNEETPMRPVSPYGVSKLAAHRLAQAYRQARGYYICCGILFNHESPRRHEAFVSRKIVKRLVEIALGRRTHIQLGDTSAWRDWGFAGDYVRAMWLMMQQARPDDYVIGTGEARQVGRWIEATIEALHVRVGWNPGREWNSMVDRDPALRRLNDIGWLAANADKAKIDLGWQPTVSFEEMVAMMVEAELARAKKPLA